jgi:hypothetical protein
MALLTRLEERERERESKKNGDVHSWSNMVVLCYRNRYVRKRYILGPPEERSPKCKHGDALFHTMHRCLNVE